MYFICIVSCSEYYCDIIEMKILYMKNNYLFDIMDFVEPVSGGLFDPKP